MSASAHPIERKVGPCAVCCRVLLLLHISCANCKHGNVVCGSDILCTVTGHFAYAGMEYVPVSCEDREGMRRELIC